MKKKGFTLMELLGSIVVLAIIALIAVPVIVGIVEKTRRSSLEDSGYGLVETATLYYAEHQIGKVARFDIENNKVETEEKYPFPYKGSIKSGTVLINKKGQITICINDGKYAAYKNYQDMKVTIVNKKTCTIPENSSIVYLDGEKTMKEMTNQELTDALADLVTKVTKLEKENENLKTEVEVLGKKQTLSIDMVYPIGSIYMTVHNVNPSILFKGTSWERYGVGRTLLSTDQTSEQIGGNATATLTTANLPSHNHSIPSLSGTTSTNGDHEHAYSGGGVAMTVNNEVGFSGMPMANGFKTEPNVGLFSGSKKNISSILKAGSHFHTFSTIPTITSNVGSGTAFNIQNPYITVYMWKRVG